MASSPLPQPPTTSQTLSRPDGRVLGYATYGSAPSPTTPTILYFHGFPGSRLEAAIIGNLPLSIHVVAIDRPGMGLSTFQPSRQIIDWPADVLALVDHLNIEQFYAVGDSGGSPYALVCAKDIPRTRLLGVAVVSGIYPLSLGTQGMLFSLRALLYAVPWLPQAVVMKIMDWEVGNAAKNADHEKFAEAFMKTMESKPEKDRKCLDDLPFRKIVMESAREAFRQGSKGPAWDLTLFGDWKFKLEEVSGENIILCHGKKDANCPFGMAEMAAKVMKGSQLRSYEDETHLSLPYNYLEEIIKDLLKI